MSRLIKTPAVRTIKKARSVEKTSATDRDNGIAARLSWFILVYLGLCLSIARSILHRKPTGHNHIGSVYRVIKIKKQKVLPKR
jgi:hypothetical protein